MPTMESVERVAYALRGLYDQYGYAQYRMSKFEEYDLYARNKDFLISDSVITFTDPGGKLMALKPDVTLSIVKNSLDRAGSVRKLYYNENVYRVTKGAHAFKEILQMGLECLGSVDDYCIFEVLSLAAQSLKMISEEAVLDISHLGLLTELMDSIGVPAEKRSALVQLLSQKNAHEIGALCAEAGISEASAAVLLRLVNMKGTPAEVLPELEVLIGSYVNSDTLCRFAAVLRALACSEIAPLLRIDFSVVDDLHYYNGFVFKGFVKGLPGSVLTGGQYDKLMRKMKRSDCAIGFAVYMDMLERLEEADSGYDVDVVLLYDSTVSLQTAALQAWKLRQAGYSVTVQPGVPEGVRYRKLMKISGEEVQTVEDNA